MSVKANTPSYMIWGADNVVYGPVELPVLVKWVKDERVLSDTWVYEEHRKSWVPANKIEDLASVFQRASRSAEDGSLTPGQIDLGSLRRIKIFAGMSDDDLQGFVDFMEVQDVSQFCKIVQRESPGDAMYLVVRGEVRVRLIIDGKESILTTLTVGDFFGEIALFDHGPRSADVVANEESQLLKISTGNFQRLLREAPHLAAPFLFGIGRTLTGRIRADNKRFSDLIHLAIISAE